MCLKPKPQSSPGDWGLLLMRGLLIPGSLAIPPLIVIAFTSAVWPAWACMWLLAFLIFCECKLVTWWFAPNCRAAPAALTAGYLFAWPGLNAPAFLAGFNRPSTPRPTFCEWRFACVKTLFGALLLFILARAMPAQFVAWTGMVGLLFILHFGCFHILSCAWRSVGVDAAPLMNFPIRARSAGDFWGRRWNTAFRDLTHRFLFRPLAARMPSAAALLAGFLVSGLVHDLVVSVPARGGYGRPTLFFLLQGALALAERTPQGRHLGLARGAVGWLATQLLLLLTLPLLFHRPFRENIFIPFMQAIGAL